MKKCEHCGLEMSINSQGTCHPWCADTVAFKKKYGGEPIFCKSRSDARITAEGFEGDRVVDAGKDKIHPGSQREIPNGSRWAVVVGS